VLVKYELEVYIVLAHWNNSPWVDMPHQTDTLSVVYVGQKLTRWWWCLLCTWPTRWVWGLYSPSSLKQHSVSRHAAPHGHIVCCVCGSKAHEMMMVSALYWTNFWPTYTTRNVSLWCACLLTDCCFSELGLYKPPTHRVGPVQSRHHHHLVSFWPTYTTRNVSLWCGMSTHGLLFQWARTIQTSNSARWSSTKQTPSLSSELLIHIHNTQCVCVVQHVYSRTVVCEYTCCTTGHLIFCVCRSKAH
jgi:hypothetical protein